MSNSHINMSGGKIVQFDNSTTTNNFGAANGIAEVREEGGLRHAIGAAEVRMMGDLSLGSRSELARQLYARGSAVARAVAEAARDYLSAFEQCAAHPRDARDAGLELQEQCCATRRRRCARCASRRWSC